MKSTEIFKRTIRNYLDTRAKTDNLFAVSYAKPHKNIDGCIAYILNTVKASGCNGFTDDEIYSVAVHFYDEDGIEPGNPVNCRVTVNHTVELTAEEKQQARKDAMQRMRDEAYAKLKQPRTKPAKQPTVIDQPTLFNF